MNKSKLSELNGNQLFINSTNPNERLRLEIRSAATLQHKTDYLSKYNYAIRLMYIHYLKQGIDIKGNVVHKALQQHLVQNHDIQEELVMLLIKSRHNLKYNGVKPDNNIFEQLMRIIELLQTR